ncbi:MAG: hypothetical protein N2689_08350, partial [Verrucomicrobiae bacterium]|nr:hypothetical protein [Verrucomicrobiae bacterium]
MCIRDRLCPGPPEEVMKTVFADTFYFLALLNLRDPYHDRAVTASRAPELRLVTTDFVLIELADALCKPRSGRRRWLSRVFWKWTRLLNWCGSAPACCSEP